MLLLIRSARGAAAQSGANACGNDELACSRAGSLEAIRAEPRSELAGFRRANRNWQFGRLAVGARPSSAVKRRIVCKTATSPSIHKPRRARLSSDRSGFPASITVSEKILLRGRVAASLSHHTIIFPANPDIRKARADYPQSEAQYRETLRKAIREAGRKQEAIGLDLLVHGEAERNDMVEYFAEQLEGFVVTRQGWVQSYGSRCVKPPIIVGDVSRPNPMTVEWIAYAQRQTRKPVKGMLTGPVTMLQWSFVRDDQPRAVTAFQIALAIRDEVGDPSWRRRHTDRRTRDPRACRSSGATGTTIWTGR